MKKAFIISVSIIVFLNLLFISVYFIVQIPKDDGSFSISEYSEEISNENFHADNTYGEINGVKSAAGIGKAAIEDRFGSLQNEWRGWTVRYDESEDVWHVYTYLIIPHFGGTYDVLIKSNGTIIAIWGGK